MAPQSELQELIAFLSDARPDMRRGAVELVSGLTGSGDGIATLLTEREALLPPLLRLLAADTETSKLAATSLVNLSQEAGVAEELIAARGVQRCADYLRERPEGCPEGLLVMLLANLTAQEGGAEALLGAGAMTEGRDMALLLDRFAASAGAAQPDAYEHVGDVLTNVTRHAGGRSALLRQPGALRAVAGQLGSGSARRRRGCAAALRNCCLGAQEEGEEGGAAALLVSAGVLEGVVNALCGTGGAAQEADGEVRELLAEAVLLAARHDGIRKHLWSFNAPELLRKGYELEEHAGVCSAMEEAAELFLSDNGGVDEVEGGAEEGEEGAAGAR